MGNMNSIDVAQNTESVGRAIHVVKIQPGNLKTFLSFFIFFHLCHTLLHHFELFFVQIGSSEWKGFSSQLVSETTRIQTGFITFMKQTRHALESFGDTFLQALCMLGAWIIARKLRTFSPAYSSI